MTKTVIMRQLHKLDSQGRKRVWYMEYSATAYRTYSGLHDGKLAVTGWTEVPKGNQGRSQAEQVFFAVQAAYKHQLERDYFELDQDPTVPKVFFPMLAHKYEAKKFQPGYAQPKLDGMRCVAKASGLFSRQGKPIESCPHIIEALKPIFEANPDLILDGEIYNHDLKEDFERLMSLARKGAKSLTPAVLAECAQLQYHVYDVPSATGDISDRIWSLEYLNAVPGVTVLDYLRDHTVLKRVNTLFIVDTETFDAFHQQVLDYGYEGSIWRAKGEDAIAGYEVDKRSKRLLKRTDKFSDEFELVNLVEGNGSWAGAAKAAQFWMKNADKRAGPNDDNTFEAGIAGTYEANKALLERGSKPRIGTVEYKGLTKTGKPRCGVVKDWDRPDA